MDKEEKNSETLKEEKQVTPVDKKTKKEHHKNNEEIKRLEEDLAKQNEKNLKIIC